MNSTKDQRFLVDGKEVVVSIVRNRESGERFAMICGREITRIPVDLLGLAADKDAWMREIRFRCVCCNEPFKACEMEGQLCPKCLEETEAYNELLDRGGSAPEETK
jgi:hypothetical protein